METTALFELRGQDGHTWKIYEDGTTEGFPADVLIINRASPLLAMLRGGVEQAPAALVADKQAESLS